jgi:hypothetical protein
MNKYRVAFVSVLMLLGTSAIAADWNSSFGAVDTDGSEVGLDRRSIHRQCFKGGWR